jgi:hypothetical protein
MVETSKQKAKGLLADVPGEYVFRCCNGHILRNLRELGEELKTMSGESYNFHANIERNDFANWVRDIIDDATLAKNLQKAPDQAQAIKLVTRRINFLSSKLA